MSLPNREMDRATSMFAGRLAVQQRVLPFYRAAFFDTLAQLCQGGLSVFAGQPGPGEAIETTDHLDVAEYIPARNFHFGRIHSRFYLCWQAGILQWLQSCQPDALIVEANPRYLTTRYAADWMHARERLVLGWGLGVSGLGNVASGSMDALRGTGRQRFLARFDGIIAYSEQGANSYRQVGIAPERVFVAPNAVARRPQNPPPDRPPEFSTQPVVLFVGRLQTRKRIDLLLQACAGSPGGWQPRLVIVGDGPARTELEELAREIYPQTEFTGARRGDDLAEIFRQADLFVLPGTGGLAAQEAMSYGLPVIVAEGDGTQSNLVRAETGWEIEPGSLEALHQALAHAFSDAGRLRSMGQAAYRLVETEVNLEHMAAAFIRALTVLTPAE